VNLLKIRRNTEWNYSYFPVIFDDDGSVELAISRLNAVGIFPRRYFAPSLSSLPYVSSVNMKVSESVSRRIICLPLYNSLLILDVVKIADLLKIE
jgi:dTDP-4-amino-4,6-dideoxygalactose transaminase